MEGGVAGEVRTAGGSGAGNFTYVQVYEAGSVFLRLTFYSVSSLYCF